mmetsp:Transcript_14126/g.37431  ORF Transcript_14126/g.37431 Transcript_14126/m.37431 type:complete len:243 (-) Transcript_14126:1143-1871(-)
MSSGFSVHNGLFLFSCSQSVKASFIFSFFVFCIRIVSLVLSFSVSLSSSSSSLSESSLSPSLLLYMPLSSLTASSSASISASSSSSSSFRALSSAPSVFFIRFLGRPLSRRSLSASAVTLEFVATSSPSSRPFLPVVDSASACFAVRMIFLRAILSFLATVPFMKASKRSLLMWEMRFSISRMGRNSKRQWYVKTMPLAAGTYWMFSFTASLARQSSSVTRRNLVRSPSAQTMRCSRLFPPL